MDLLVITLGSAGDVHPYLGIGTAMRARGHGVTVATYPAFEAMVRSAGLGYVALPRPDKAAYQGILPESDHHGSGGAARRLLGAALHPLSRPWRRLARASTVLPLLRPVYAIITDRFVPGQTVVVASGDALGARVAHDRLGVPLVTAYLAPAYGLRSARHPPIQPPLPLTPRAPARYNRAVYWLADRLVIDQVLGPALNAFRRELGLPPVRRLFAEWRHSPQRVLGLFPPWFGEPQPDWPARTALTGFPLYDEGPQAELPAPLQQFLDRGPPPVVFTPGSAMKRAGQFFEEAIRSCEQLGRRGLLLTRFREQVPERLPDAVRHVEYAPLSRLLPHAAALVHHGGIGTAAQALRAGKPQVVVPRRHDQWDNAERLRRLGVAQVLGPAGRQAHPLTEALDQLLTSSEVNACCRAVARRLEGEEAMEQSCRVIEEMLPQARAA
jgi:UDP:flavonoid glycosyltransferase YjiC (YdhE family)